MDFFFPDATSMDSFKKRRKSPAPSLPPNLEAECLFKQIDEMDKRAREIAREQHDVIKEALDSGIPEVRSYIEGRYMNCRYNNYPKTRKTLDELIYWPSLTNAIYMSERNLEYMTKSEVEESEVEELEEESEEEELLGKWKTSPSPELETKKICLCPST